MKTSSKALRKRRKVAYKYKGNTLDRLLQSYQKDKEPYTIDPTTQYPERKSGFEELRRLRELLFPNYWNCGFITKPENKTELEIKINELGQALFDAVWQHILDQERHIPNKERISEIVDEVLNRLPNIRETLKKDVVAAYNGDPAAKSYTEIIRSYPSFKAILVQRVAHVLYELEVPSYPRDLTELIKSVTGIDIHPGAQIGEYFFIDHGSGVVIGETSEIGRHVRMYQGVTLGALHFEKDEGGMLKKGYKRHPTIGNNVVIGMGASIIGTVTIGNHVSVGAGSQIEKDIPDDTTVFIRKHPELEMKQNHKT